MTALAFNASPDPRDFPVVDLGLSQVPREPPGNAGQLVRYIYHSAILPVPEVAVAAALGLLAGICGRAWNTWTGAQLNLYIVLVARSGIGKEHARDSVQRLVKAAAGDHVMLTRFVNWADIASGPALLKACAANPCFVSMQGEWGHILKAMASPRSHEGPMGQLRRAITSLYSNKAPVGINYSDTERNVTSEGSVAFSMLAETTPSTFYGALTADMLADGFMSRFTIIEYLGDRPDDNPKRTIEPDQRLLDLLKTLMVRASFLMQQMETRGAPPEEVSFSLDGCILLDDFKKECAASVRGAGDNEGRRQLWNRAHLKALKIACLLAIADDCLHPEASAYHALWAIDLVRYDVALFDKRITGGDVGDDDIARRHKLLAMCREYLASNGKGAAVPDAMSQQGVIPRRYLQQRTSSLPIFKHAVGGAIRALDSALKSLTDDGYLYEVDKLKTADTYGYQGRCFLVHRLPDGSLD